MSQEVLLDLSFLTEDERDIINSVISKDVDIRKQEQNRISSLRKELDRLKEDGLAPEELESKNENYCARCQTYFGVIFNRGAYCPRCKLKVCKDCRVDNIEQDWICTLCHKVRQVKAQTGAWFFQDHKQKTGNLFGSMLVRQSMRRLPGRYPLPQKDEKQSRLGEYPKEINAFTTNSKQGDLNSNEAKRNGGPKMGYQYSDESESDQESNDGSLDQDFETNSDRTHSKGESDSSESLDADHNESSPLTSPMPPINEAALESPLEDNDDNLIQEEGFERDNLIQKEFEGDNLIQEGLERDNLIQEGLESETKEYEEVLYTGEASKRSSSYSQDFETTKDSSVENISANNKKMKSKQKTRPASTTLDEDMSYVSAPKFNIPLKPLSSSSNDEGTPNQQEKESLKSPHSKSVEFLQETKEKAVASEVVDVTLKETKSEDQSMADIFEEVFEKSKKDSVPKEDESIESTSSSLKENTSNDYKFGPAKVSDGLASDGKKTETSFDINDDALNQENEACIANSPKGVSNYSNELGVDASKVSVKVDKVVMDDESSGYDMHKDKAHSKSLSEIESNDAGDVDNDKAESLSIMSRVKDWEKKSIENRFGTDFNRTKSLGGVEDENIAKSRKSDNEDITVANYDSRGNDSRFEIDRNLAVDIRVSTENNTIEKSEDTSKIKELEDTTAPHRDTQGKSSGFRTDQDLVETNTTVQEEDTTSIEPEQISEISIRYIEDTTPENDEQSKNLGFETDERLVEASLSSTEDDITGITFQKTSEIKTAEFKSSNTKSSYITGDVITRSSPKSDPFVEKEEPSLLFERHQGLEDRGNLEDRASREDSETSEDHGYLDDRRSLEDRGNLEDSHTRQDHVSFEDRGGLVDRGGESFIGEGKFGNSDEEESSNKETESEKNKDTSLDEPNPYKSEVNVEEPAKEEEPESLDSREDALRAFSETFVSVNLGVKGRESREDRDADPESDMKLNDDLTPEAREYLEGRDSNEEQETREDRGSSRADSDASDSRRSSDIHGFQADTESTVSETSGYATPTASEDTTSKPTPSISGDEGTKIVGGQARRTISETAPVIVTTELPEEPREIGRDNDRNSSITDYDEDTDVSFSKFGEVLGTRKLKDQLSLGSRESIASYYSNAGGEVYGKYPVSGEVLFGIKYDPKIQEFQIQIHQARDITAVDKKNKTSDAYIKTYLLPDRTRTGKRKSKVKKNTVNPVFDEILTYKISYDEILQRTLWLAVWNHDTFGHNDFLGEVLVAIDEYHQSGFSLEDPEPRWYELCERQAEDPQLSYNGEIVFALKYVPPSVLADKKKKKKKKKSGEDKGELHVNIIEASNLMAKDSNGFSDPFCKSYLLPDKSKKTKQKTAVVKKSLNPKWNYQFVYENVTEEELMNRVLELTVWDFDRGSSNEFLGGVRLGLGTGVQEWDDATSEEQAAWNKMLNNPNEWNQMSLVLREHMGSHK